MALEAIKFKLFFSFGIYFFSSFIHIQKQAEPARYSKSKTEITPKFDNSEVLCTFKIW
jgi:hypothetical protein